ncbi:MAG TPA: alanine racemase, partial [Rhodopila sp.]|nr:alanine racemase [Rhodopila sp.]
MSSSGLPTSVHQAVLDIDLGAIVANWRTLRSRHPSGDVAGVVKADAYGLGADRVAPALHQAGCRHFFVAYLEEAVSLRKSLPHGMLAVLSGLMPGTEDTYVALGLTPVLGSLDEIARWCAAGARLGRRLDAILHIDTGMARLGLDMRELAVLAADHQRLDGLALRFVMTHLVSSEVPDDPLNAAQAVRFAAARASLPAAPASLANSSGIFLGPTFGSDLARPGAALYGINPTPGLANPMCPVVVPRAPVLSV